MVLYAIFFLAHVRSVRPFDFVPPRRTSHLSGRERRRDRGKAGASLSEALEPCSQGRRRSQVTLSFAPKSGAILAPNAALL